LRLAWPELSCYATVGALISADPPTAKAAIILIGFEGEE
jgi:hypothetical protein